MFGQDFAKNAAINAVVDTLKKKISEVNPEELASLLGNAFTHEIEALRAADTDGNHVDDLSDCEKDAAEAAAAFGRIVRRLQAVHEKAAK